MVMLRAWLVLLLCAHVALATHRDGDDEAAESADFVTFLFREDITVRCRNNVLKTDQGPWRHRKVYCS